ncbi:hypothetical protein CHLRE_02g106500v5 [Chlamydomonas reinhardtii]|uniref:Uncharacterized protein n=1 Tax=Chlamydomonas reinhardtii TaxID=3055 RepID=A8I408_CHLRE|nr:uncharacterized protein CHLRE_02g106500v5 [Chlamydomonas reinhardtii]PNW87043.1 hypothetical protein CHLRE_02g106500v5 [Chlamydomonas reinhardtii]|eukprot:XP_001699969.1 MutT/NUDIX hydrolase [Chlamydomonas reinhardtii]
MTSPQPPACGAALALLPGGPVPDVSRVGRHKQRYGDSGERLVAGCIPVKFSGCPKSAEHVQVCMITTTSGKGLVFPKGGWEDDESVESAAQRETVEEAGVRGMLEEPLLGVFPFTSGKYYIQEGQSAATPGRCKAYIYVMHVAEELPCWPESNDRQRVWCSISEAARQCKHQWMREALQAWVRRRGWDESLAAASASGGSVGAGVSTGVQQQAPEVASAGDGEIRFGSTSLHFGDDSRAFDFKAAAAAAAVGPCVSSNST